MLIGFTSTEFVLLFPVIILLYYIFPNKYRHYFLLLINLCFYASFGVVGIIIIFLEAIIIYGASFAIIHDNSLHKKRIYSIVCALLLALILIAFKVGVSVSDSLVAPLGLSFYTLGAIAYIVDVGKGVIEPEKRFIKLITWMTFFPTITSGPIYRYKTFEKEYSRNINGLNADYTRITNGIIYMIYGYFIKLVIAERAAIPVNYAFDNLGKQYFNFIILITIAVTYSIQIYADFAGYSAMVIGMAQILGYKVPENFMSPYLAQSIKEFWGRWHISLSTWLRDYIYIPLGGNRKGTFRKHINIVITFVVSALWHGMGLHFMVWGMMHAFYQIIGDITGKYRTRILGTLSIKSNNALLVFMRRVGTFILVTVAWLFFRTGVNDALFFIKQIFTATLIDKEKMWIMAGMGIEWSDWIVLLISCLFMVLVDHWNNDGERIDTFLAKKSFFVRGTTVVFMLVIVLLFGVYGDQHDPSYFIYRNF